MKKATVAIVGRPNVGKSTLFNRILGGRSAIVSEHAGTTRDRHFGDGEWAGRRFWLVDTGGLVPDSSESMDRAIRRQVEIALEEALRIKEKVAGTEVGVTEPKAAFSACLPQSTMRCHSVCSCFSPSFDVQFSVVAMLKLATGAPPGV